MMVAWAYFGYQDWLLENNGDPAGWWTHYLAESLLSLVADVFGAILLVIFTKKLWEKGSDVSAYHPEDEEE